MISWWGVRAAAAVAATVAAAVAGAVEVVVAVLRLVQGTRTRVMLLPCMLASVGVRQSDTSTSPLIQIMSRTSSPVLSQSYREGVYVCM